MGSGRENRACSPLQRAQLQRVHQRIRSNLQALSRTVQHTPKGCDSNIAFAALECNHLATKTTWPQKKESVDLRKERPAVGAISIRRAGQPHSGLDFAALPSVYSETIARDVPRAGLGVALPQSGLWIGLLTHRPLR